MLLNRGKLIHETDKVFSQLLRKVIDKCELGNSRCNLETLQVSHNYTKASSGLGCRWNALNVMLLCNEHHRYWEQIPTSIRESILRKRLGMDKYMELQKLRNSVCIISNEEIEQIRKDIKQKLK